MRGLVFVLAMALGCAAPARRAVPGPPEPAGCCCSYHRCTPGYTQRACVADAEFEGWTYTWHEGTCGETDRFPAPDIAPAR